MDKRSIGQKITLVLFGILLGLILIELGLRLAGFIILTCQERANRLSLQKKNSYVILCLGESTTACGGEFSYPRQLEIFLNEKNIGVTFSVINKGIIATQSPSILSRLEDYLDIYHPNIVVTMMGINDMYQAGNPDNTKESNLKLFFQGCRLYKLAKLIRERIALKFKITTGDESSNTENKFGEKDDYPEIEERYKQVILADPNNTAIYLKLGDWYYEQGRLEEAGETYRKLIALNPDDAALHIKVGHYFRNRKMWKEAEDVFNQAIERFPRNSMVCAEAANFYNWVHSWVKAEKYFLKAIEINPDNFWASRKLAVSYQGQGREEEAERLLKNLIELHPDELSFYLELANYFKRNKNWADAEGVYKQALDRNFKNERLYAALSFCSFMRGEDKLAEKYTSRLASQRTKWEQSITGQNYRRLKEIVSKRGIKLICVQYPMRPVSELIKMFYNPEGIVFVDNEKIFKDAVRKSSYKRYFIDYFAGDFGHCTNQGNILLAENIGIAIIGKILDIDLGNSHKSEKTR